MQQIRAVSLMGYLEVAASLGLDGNAMLRAAGIAREALSDPENRARLVILARRDAGLLCRRARNGLRWGTPRLLRLAYRSRLA